MVSDQSMDLLRPKKNLKNTSQITKGGKINKSQDLDSEARLWSSNLAANIS